MPGDSKASEHFSSSSGSGLDPTDDFASPIIDTPQKTLQEAAAEPFSSPASPIPKNYDDTTNLITYPNQIAGSSNGDSSEPYILSSMSEEDHLKNALPQDNKNTKTGGGKIDKLNTTEVQLIPSTSSEENKYHSNNNSPRPPQPTTTHVVPVNFKKKELRCVTDVPPPVLTTVGTGSFSPLGSVGSNNGSSMETPTGSRFQLPKFYDSEEEGLGSLVLVPSSRSMTSPRMVMGANSNNNSGGMVAVGPNVPQFPAPKDRQSGTTPTASSGSVGLSTTPAHLLPYQQRKQLVEQQPDKRPPVIPPSSSKVSSFGTGGMVMVAASEPLPTVSNAELAKKYGGLAEIPPFRGGVEGDGGVVNDDTVTPMKKSKSADTSNKPVQPPPPPVFVSSPSNNSQKREKRIDESSPKQGRPLPRPTGAGPITTQQQEVICPPPQSPSMRSSSPSGESYHIRISSCGSISSLGSTAVDSDSIRNAPRREHSNPQRFYHQQQMQQQHPPPPPPPNHYYGGYPPAQGMRGPPQNGFDLSQDIAMYLHGEQVANGEAMGRPHQPPPYHHQHHGGEYPSPNYWNNDPSYGWGGGGPYQQYPPTEPIPPPLTQVPNMQMGHRSRLPSISDDDWSEDLEKYKDDLDDVEEGKRGGGGIARNGNYPTQRSYNYSRDRMAYPHQLPPPAQKRTKRKENRSENRPDERSSLLGRHRNYEENGLNGDNPNHSYYQTPPRRGKKKNPQETKSTKRKKSKRRRRTEKEKLRNLYSTDSSPEDEEKFRRSIRSARRKKRGGRKKRDDDVSDTMSESYSESYLSASLTERMKSAERNVNFFQRLMIRTKLLICNLPLSAAAISFSIVLLGIVWLRRAEEMLTSCKEVNFHSSQCNFPEFPGCYFCDTFDNRYQMAVTFHTVCSYVGGLSVALYAAKAMLFGRVFIDEMSSPTTASPAGLIFMTMALAFTGKGPEGAVAVFVASFLHFALLLWFIYMSLAYQTMPDPSWFPNTIGIGLCAVKVWFYNPLWGHFLIAMSLMLTFLYYPISLIRVALNDKMSSTICWMQMICPAISLYSLAIVMQPSFKEERPDISHFQIMQRSVYLPSMTCLFGLCIVGMISSLHGFVKRWKQIQKEEFTPAHAAYSFPLLMHALAVQSYQSSLGFFSETGEVNPTFKYALEIYWIVLVIAGTLVAVVCLAMYLSFLPSWIDINTSEELEPPSPNETSMFETVTWGESLIQPYVSPTILQSNEAGLLIMVHDYENKWDTLVRTKKIPAVGFEPMMRTRAFNREREALKHLVGGQDVIHEGDEPDDDFCFENVNM